MYQDLCSVILTTALHLILHIHSTILTHSAICLQLLILILVLARLRAALTTLEDAKATLLSQERSSSRGRSKELEMLMTAAKRGGPLHHVGLRGRLGDLATIDPEFDVAIRYEL